MARSIKEVMTSDPRTVDAADSVADAAKIMAEADVGAVIVVEDGQVSGIVTDRDIAVRAVAEGRDPSGTKAGEIATGSPTTLSPDDSVDDAVKAMEEQNVRRLPVVEDGRPVGIVSLGDVAEERDAGEALADISSAPPNN
jgi:CBS domain-containing protein